MLKLSGAQGNDVPPIGLLLEMQNPKHVGLVVPKLSVLHHNYILGTIRVRYCPLFRPLNSSFPKTYVSSRKLQNSYPTP